MTVQEACGAYLRELEAQNVRKSTREGYQSLFRRLRAFASNEDIESIEGLDKATLTAWRAR